MKKDSDKNLTETLIQSAIAKCIDFNIEANNLSENRTSPFFLMGNSRAVCEELIYSALFRKLGHVQSESIAIGILKVQHLKSILAQTKFFSKNNELQSAFGSHQSPSQQEQGICNAEVHLKDVWKQQGFNTTPSIQRLAREVGLETTYGYVYHMSSNFVHFNPNQLLRLGWGQNEGPFVFSIKHFEGYYSAVSRFLGAIVFLGYCCTFPDMFKSGFAEKCVKHITSRLESNARWPEIITFEEMNQDIPTILTRAVMSIIRNKNNDGFPNILSELQSLRNMN